MLSSLSNEDRKRSFVHPSEQGPRKRLHSDETPPKPNSADAEDDADDETLHPAYAGLEAFRKEAIYRRLLEARRDLQRSERQTRSCRESLSISEQKAALLERFWALFLADLAARLGLPDQGTPQLHLSADDKTDVEVLQTELKQQTTSFLEAIVPQNNADPTSQAVELQQKYHDLAEEAIKHKQDLFITQSKLQRAEDALADSSQKLAKVERDYVRYQSSLLRTAEGNNPPPPSSTPAPDAKDGESTKDGAAAKSEATDGQEPTSQESAAALQKAAEDLEKVQQDLELTRRESDSRYAEIQTLNEEVKALKLKQVDLNARLQNLPEELLVNSAPYRELQSQLQHLQSEARSADEAKVSLQSENATLREERDTYRNGTDAESGVRAEELEKQLKLKDADVTRLRTQRDDLNSELSERRSREQVKFTQIEEMKALLNSKEERLLVLTSQVRRLRLTVAALRGDKASSQALSAAASEEDQFEQISEAVRQAQSRVAELEKQLGSSDARQPNGADDEADLKSQVDQLKLALQAAEASCTAVDDELEKISGAYAELEKQASVKVTDVSRMEEKMLRLVTEKSKADNKYFSAMRAKDTYDNEIRAAKQTIDRQNKIIEHLTEKERSFGAQLKLHEKEVSVFRRSTDAHHSRIVELQRELAQVEVRLAEATQSKAAAAESSKDLIASATDEKDQRRRGEERIVRLEKELESAKRQMAKAAASAARTKGRRESEAGDSSEKDFLNALLQCSSCKERYRNRILTKCYHTFCDVCIDTRVQTRQRKCPHCGLAFAVNDVQPLYLQ